MPRKASNQLTITPGPDGWFFLKGYISGQQVRRKNKNLQELETLKTELEDKAAKEAIAQAVRPVERPTRLTQEQLEQAEAIFNEFKELPRPLPEYIRAGMAMIGDGSRTLLLDDGDERGAVGQWDDYMKIELNLRGRTADRNRRVVERMLEANPEFKHVCDITAEAVEKSCSVAEVGESGGSNYTKVTRMWAFGAFFKFCLKRKFIRQAVWQVDEAEVAKLVKIARKQKGDPVVLSGVQAHALLNAAIEHDPRYIPYVVLCLWCFTRPSEAESITPDRLRLDARTPFIQPRGGKVGTKNYRETHVPAVMVPVLRRCLDTGLWTKGQPPYFSVNSFRNLREKAGLIKMGKNATAKGYRRTVGGVWVPDIMRHTGISMLYQKLATAQGDFFDKKGNADFAALQKEYPEFFKKLIPNGDAGDGNDNSASPTNMNDIIRKAAGVVV